MLLCKLVPSVAQLLSSLSLPLSLFFARAEGGLVRPLSLSLVCLLACLLAVWAPKEPWPEGLTPATVRKSRC